MKETEEGMETEEDIAARVAGSHSVNSEGEKPILAGVRAGIQAARKEAQEGHQCNGKGDCAYAACEECTEALRTNSYELGVVVGLEGLPGVLRAKAGEAFINQKDAEAKLLRDLAKECEKRAKEARDAYATKYNTY